MNAFKMKGLKTSAALIVLIGSFLVSSQGFAEYSTASAVAKVNGIQIHGDGRILITGFSFPTAANCANKDTFWIKGTHPKRDALLSLILTAKATGANLHVKADTSTGCLFPEITEGADTTIYIVNP